MLKIDEMKVLPGTTVSRTCKVNTESQAVRLVNVSHNKPTDSNYRVDWTFDFSNCTEAEILELAARSAVIAYRKNFRDETAANIPNFAERTIDVHVELMMIERTGKTKEERAKSLLAAMTKEERLALLREIEG